MSISSFVSYVGDNVAELFQRIAIISMENLVMKELSRLRKDEMARQVQLEKSTLISELVHSRKRVLVFFSL